MDRIGYYFVVPLLLAIVYLGGTISGRSRHSRTLYQCMSEFFIVLTAVYLAPMGVVPLWLSLVALVGALAVGQLLRWVVGRGRLFPVLTFISSCTRSSSTSSPSCWDCSSVWVGRTGSHP